MTTDISYNVALASVYAYDQAIDDLIRSRDRIAYDWNNRTSATPEERDATVIPYRGKQ